MRPPVFRNDVPGLLPQLTQTVKDICDYLPSQRLTSNTLQLEEHRCGTIINVKDDTQPIIPAAGEAVAEDVDFFSSYNTCDLYDTYKKAGEKQSSKVESANSGVLLEINKYTVNLNGVYARFAAHYYKVTDIAADFFNKNPSLSATDNSALYGSIRLSFSITSGMPSPSAATVFNYPPIYYTWDLSSQLEWEHFAHFSSPSQADISNSFPSKGNYDGLGIDGMPSSVNSIVGLFKLSNLRDFSEKWHGASGALSGMDNPKLDAYVKTTDYNPSIFLSFTDSLLDYVNAANGEDAQ